MRSLVLMTLVAVGCSSGVPAVAPTPSLAMDTASNEAPPSKVVCSVSVNEPFIQATEDITKTSTGAFCANEPLLGEARRIGLFLYGTAYTIRANPGTYDISPDDGSLQTFDMQVQRLMTPVWNCENWSGSYSYAESSSGWTLHLAVTCMDTNFAPAIPTQYRIKLDLAGAL